MMVDWFGSSKRVRGLVEQIAALRAEIASFRDERARGLVGEAGEQISIVALKQSVDASREHGALIAAEVSDLRNAVDALNSQSVRSIEWRAIVDEDERHRQRMEEGRTRLEMAVLKLERRLQMQAEQAAKTATALLERIELLRRSIASSPDAVED